MKKVIGVLLSLAIVLLLMPALNLRALAGSPYSGFKNTTKEIKFDGKDWYLIDYDDSTVTLLSKDFVAKSSYNGNHGYVEYKNSIIKGVVDDYYNKTFSAEAKKAVNGNAMFLLTTDQASAITNDDVRRGPRHPDGNDDWWLCSPGKYNYEATWVNGGYIRNGIGVSYTLGVRPALKLTLSSVTFSSNTFSVKPAVAITKAPTVPILNYDGSAKKLVTAGEANGGTIQYALGENETTAPQTGWSTTIPTAANVGTYYVWYKALPNDANHLESDPRCLKAVIVDIYSPFKDTTTLMNFDGKEWYLIDYDDSTVTLLAKECVAAAEYNSGGYVDQYVVYKDSTIKGVVDSYYKDNISADAKTAVSGNAMFLLTDYQAKAVKNADVLKCSQYPGAERNAWWLCSMGDNSFQAAVVNGDTGYLFDNGHGVTFTYGVRPALKLNLSAVNFSDNTFSVRPAVAVSKAPTAKDLKPNGSAQELLTAGEATGGTMQYALGENETIAPTNGWSTAIPAKTETGTYYVWYKAVADDGSQSETVPKCVKAVIAGSGAADDPDPTPGEGESVVYRLYNPNSGDHLFTQNVAEKDNLITLGWKYEGVAWYAPEFPDVPVYRLYNPNNGDHHYTTDVFERDHLIDIGWNDEGIGWYSEVLIAVPIYRLYDPNALLGGAHHFTVDMAERDHLIELGWKDEGIGWYGM